MMNKKSLTVADFFCGAGGFSEGFAQKGFNVVFALDNWQPAVTTHRFNQPTCRAVKMDILDLNTPEKINHYVPDVDVIIGGPPCVSFSGSNKAGKADKTLGIQLIEAYLRIVLWKLKNGNLKYWVLENVPNAEKYIMNEYTWKDLDLPGTGPNLVFEEKRILNAAEFNTPQARKRFFGGKVPLPEPYNTNPDNFNTLQNVLDSLTNPLGKNKDLRIMDPNYEFTFESSLLTDHFYDTRVAEFEWLRAKNQKEDHGYMGKMAFPENTNQPSRTIMATRSASTRESIILNAYNDKNEHIGYRLPTIREISSIMSFPITYQFDVMGEASKYRLVGNAVCAKLSAAIAESILISEELEIPNYIKPDLVRKTIYDLTGTRRIIKTEKNKSYNSRFAKHIPYLKIKGFRVDLTNIDSDFKNGHIKWSCILHRGAGKDTAKCYSNECNLEGIIKEIPNFISFKNDVLEAFKDIDISHKQLHDSFIYVNSKLLSPDKALLIMRKIIDKHFKNDEEMINNKKQLINIDRELIPVKIVAGLYICDYFISRLN